MFGHFTTSCMEGLKSYFQVITDVCVKIVVLKVCFEKKTKESVVGTFKNTSRVRLHC